MNNRLLILFIFLPLLGLSQAGKYRMDHNSVLERIKSDLYVLASDSLQGRESGTAGEEKAYNYIINEFRRIGLEPAGNDSGSFLQPFPHKSTDYSERWKRNSLSCSGKTYSIYREFSATRFSADTSAEGNLFIPEESFYSTDLFSESKNLPKDLPGGIALIDVSRLRSEQDIPGKYSHLKDFLDLLFESGAKGIILWDSKARDHPDLFVFRKPESSAGPVLFVTWKAGKELAKHSGGKVKLCAYKPISRTILFHNVIGKIDHHSERTIIIGAHYDHLGKGAGKGRKMWDTLTMYGADDNASGTAGMLELARYFRQSGDTSVNYIFVAFSGEEEGLLGSKFFCDHLPSGTGNVRFMVNFDMIGRLGCEGNVVTILGKGSSPYWKTLYRKVDHPAFGIRKLSGAPEFSDHYPFLKKNIPVIYLTTGTHPQYHTSNDRAERINYSGMADLVGYSEALISRALEQKQIPYREIPGITQFFLTVGMVLKQL